MIASGRYCVPFVCALLFLSGTMLARAQLAPAPPSENKGLASKQLAVVDLADEIKGMSGRHLRMRLQTVAPGGIIGVHSHVDRPGNVYVLQGRITEHRGDVTREYGPGDTWSEDRNTIHWLENKGATDAVWISTDILNEP